MYLPVKKIIFLFILLSLTILLFSCNKEEQEVLDEPPLPPGEIIHVPADYPTIKMAAYSAGINDTILVASGTYYEHDILLKAGTHLIGIAGNADSVIIDADSIGRCIYFSGEKYESSIIGITLLRGKITTGEFPYNAGGGFFGEGDAPILISECKFLENNAIYGGGLFWGKDNENVAITLSNCIFNNNTAIHPYGGDGGNLYIRHCEATIQSCMLINGEARSGGGVYASGSIAFYDCLFKSNMSREHGNGACLMGSNSVFERCTWENNITANHFSSNSGGGLYTSSESSVLKNCFFLNNECHSKGGGICAVNTISLQNCVFAHNKSNHFDDGGGALYFNSSYNSTAIIENCTMYGNSSESELGSGVYGVNGILNIYNSIISNGEIGTSIYISESVTFIIECTDIWGNSGGDWIDRISDFSSINGNFSFDPLYSTEYFNIYPASPCAPDYNDCNTLIGAMPVE